MLWSSNSLWKPKQIHKLPKCPWWATHPCPHWEPLLPLHVYMFTSVKVRDMRGGQMNHKWQLRAGAMGVLAPSLPEEKWNTLNKAMRKIALCSEKQCSIFNWDSHLRLKDTVVDSSLTRRTPDGVETIERWSSMKMTEKNLENYIQEFTSK